MSTTNNKQCLNENLKTQKGLCEGLEEGLGDRKYHQLKYKNKKGKFNYKESVFAGVCKVL